MMPNSCKTTVTRDRDANFSTMEMELLVECVARYKDVLENKKTDSSTTNAKKRAWASIATVFEQTYDCKSRTPQQLEAKWKGLKVVSISHTCTFKSIEVKVESFFI